MSAMTKPPRELLRFSPRFSFRVSFDQESLYTVTRRVVLDETFDAVRDIWLLLRVQDGFAFTSIFLT